MPTPGPDFGYELFPTTYQSTKDRTIQYCYVQKSLPLVKQFISVKPGLRLMVTFLYPRSTMFSMLTTVPSSKTGLCQSPYVYLQVPAVYKGTLGPLHCAN